MKAIFLVGTSHEAYQIRPKSAPQDGADAFKRYVQKAVRTYAVQSIAEEMSAQALNDRHTVCQEVADENNLSHILCDPTCSERQSLGISKDNTSDAHQAKSDAYLHWGGHSAGYFRFCRLYPLPGHKLGFHSHHAARPGG